MAHGSTHTWDLAIILKQIRNLLISRSLTSLSSIKRTMSRLNNITKLCKECSLCFCIQLYPLSFIDISNTYDPTYVEKPQHYRHMYMICEIEDEHVKKFLSKSLCKQEFIDKTIPCKKSGWLSTIDMKRIQKVMKDKFKFNWRTNSLIPFFNLNASWCLLISINDKKCFSKLSFACTSSNY